MDFAPILFTRELAMEVVSPVGNWDLVVKGYTMGPGAQAALPQTVIHSFKVGIGQGNSTSAAIALGPISWKQFARIIQQTTEPILRISATANQNQ
jgi:hypothetical protein